MTVRSGTFLPKAAATFFRFVATVASKSITFLALGPTAIFHMYVSGPEKRLPRGPLDATHIALALP